VRERPPGDELAGSDISGHATIESFDTGGDDRTGTGADDVVPGTVTGGDPGTDTPDGAIGGVASGKLTELMTPPEESSS